VARRNNLAGWVLVSPVVVGLAVFTLYPVLASLALSFCEYDIFTPPRWIGLWNYKTMLTRDPLFWKSLGNVLYYTILAVPLGILFGVGLALLLDARIKGLAIYRTLFFLPSIVPVVATSVLWIWLLNPQIGLVNTLLRLVGIEGPTWLASVQWSKESLVFMGVWGVGGSMLIYLAGLKDIPASLYEAALVDGANAWQRVRYVTLPMLTPVIFFNLVMGMIGAFQYFTPAYVMTQGGPPDCMAQWESVIPAWAERGALTPLDTLMPPDEWHALRDRLYTAVRDIGMYKGHFYGLSTGMNIWAVYYRPDHFREAGLDPDKFPKTLEDLDAAADKLFQYDSAGRITRIGFSPRWLVQYVAVFGGSLYDPATDRLTFTNPKNVEALEWITGRADKYGFERILQFESGLSTTMQASWPFISGAFSMVLDGQWRVEQLAKFAPELEYRVAPIPPPKGGKPLACWSNGNFMIIPSGARHKEGAWAFMRFWSGVDNPERAAEFYTWGGWLPITPEVAAAPVYQAYCNKYPQFRTFLEVMASPNVQVTPPVPVQAYMMNRVGWAEDAALRKHLSPREALEQAARETEKEIENERVGKE